MSFLRWICSSIGIRCRRRWLMMMMMMMMLHTACFDFIQSITLRDFSFFFFLSKIKREVVQKKKKRLQTSFVSPGALPMEYRRGLEFPVSIAEFPP